MSRVCGKVEEQENSDEVCRVSWEGAPNRVSGVITTHGVYSKSSAHVSLRLQTMSVFFHPANPKYRRGVKILSISLCTIVSANILIADFGPHEHVFSPVVTTALFDFRLLPCLLVK